MKSQSVSRLAVFIKLLLILVSLLLLLLIFVVFRFNYEGFVKFISEQYGEPDKVAQLRSEYLTVQTFEFLKYFLLFFTACVLVSFVLLRKAIPTVALFFYGTFAQLLDLNKILFREIRSLSLAQMIVFVLFMVFVIASRSYLMLEYPLIYDEVFSFLYFTDKGFLPSAVYYPGPNNHIFFSELTVFASLFSNDPLLIMRLPSLIAGVFLTFLFFLLVKRKFNFETALISSFVLSFSYNHFFYSIHGRGYIMFALLFLLVFFTSLKITEPGAKRIYRLLYIFCSTLGFYTIPVFLYPFAALFIFSVACFLTDRRFRDLWHFMVLNMITAVLVLALYLPVFVLNGVGAVTGNKWVEPLTWDSFFATAGSYSLETFDYLWDLQMGGAVLSLLIFAGGVFVLFQKGEKKMAWSILLSVMLLPVFLVIQRVQPFYRIWDYLMILFALLSGVLMNYLISRWKRPKLRTWMVSSVCALVLLIHLYLVIDEVQRGFPYFAKLNSFMESAMIVKPERIYVEDDTYKIYLTFYSRQRQQEMRLFTEFSHLHFDMVIIPRHMPFPKFLKPSDFKPYIFNGYIRSYLKK